MLKAFPHHTPLAKLTPDSPTAHNEKMPSLSELYCDDGIGLSLAKSCPKTFGTPVRSEVLGAPFQIIHFHLRNKVTFLATERSVTSQMRGAFDKRKLNWFDQSSSWVLEVANPVGLIVNCMCPNSDSMRGGDDFIIDAHCES